MLKCIWGSFGKALKSNEEWNKRFENIDDDFSKYEGLEQEFDQQFEH